MKNGSRECEKGGIKMNNKNSKMLGIILVPLVFGILILVASAFTKEPKKARGFLLRGKFEKCNGCE